MKRPSNKKDEDSDYIFNDEDGENFGKQQDSSSDYAADDSNAGESMFVDEDNDLASFTK